VNISDVISKAEEGEEVPLAQTDWFTDSATDELERAYVEFERKFEAFLPSFVARLGPPDITEKTAPELASEIYLEAVRLAAWKHSEGYWVLAFGQHDKETPVFVSFGFREI
jgi:hypothetical protein